VSSGASSSFELAICDPAGSEAVFRQGNFAGESLSFPASFFERLFQDLRKSSGNFATLAAIGPAYVFAQQLAAR
jgi:hypothetical protein